MPSRSAPRPGRRSGLLAALALAACATPSAPLPLAAASRRFTGPRASPPSRRSHAPPPPSPDPPPPPPAAPARPRLTSQARTTWIYARPRADARTYLGYVRSGSSVALRSAERLPGEGCAGGFYPVEPRGYVCNDHTITLAPSPRFVALAAAAAPSPGAYPYRYAFSDGAPMYTRIPTPEEQARAERTFGPADSRTRPRKRRSTYDDLASTDAVDPEEPAPPFVETVLETGERGPDPVREAIPRGSMLSFTHAYTAAGRTFLLSADRALVPADRVRVFRRSSFHGVPLGGDVALPIAWVRRKDRPQYHLLPGGALEPAGGSWPAKRHVPLGAAIVEREGRRYRETRDLDAAGAPLYVAVADVSIVEPAGDLPIGVKPGQKWILVHLGEGTLIAYEGLRPVYTTLMSPGRGGIPVAGRDPVEPSPTPPGVYYVTFKDRAADMSHDKLRRPAHALDRRRRPLHAVLRPDGLRAARGLLARPLRRGDERRLHQRVAGRRRGALRVERSGGAAGVAGGDGRGGRGERRDDGDRGAALRVRRSLRAGTVDCSFLPIGERTTGGKPRWIPLLPRARPGPTRAHPG